MEIIQLYQSDRFTFSYVTENNTTIFFDIAQLYDMTFGNKTAKPIGALISYSVGGVVLSSGQRIIPNQFIIAKHKQIVLDIGNFAIIREDGSYPFFDDQRNGFSLAYFTKDEIADLNNSEIYCYG